MISGTLLRAPCNLTDGWTPLDQSGVVPCDGNIPAAAANRYQNTSVGWSTDAGGIWLLHAKWPFDSTIMQIDPPPVWIATRTNYRLAQFEENGRRLVASGPLVNGLPVWHGSRTDYIFRAEPTGNRFVLFSELRYPEAALMTDGTTWVGDSWWEFTLDARGAVTMIPGGENNNAPQPTAPTVSLVWQRWERSARRSGASDEPFGVYDPLDGETETLVLGSQIYRDDGADGSEEWRQSADGSKYVCSARNLTLYVLSLETEHVEGKFYRANAAPNPGSGCTLVPMMGSVEDPDRDPLELEFVRCESSLEHRAGYIGGVALWR